MSALERRYVLLLKLFPAAFRAKHEASMLATLMDCAAPEQRWPSARETMDLVSQAALLRIPLFRGGAAMVLALWLPLLAAWAGTRTRTYFSAWGPAATWRDYYYPDIVFFAGVLTSVFVLCAVLVRFAAGRMNGRGIAWACVLALTVRVAIVPLGHPIGGGAFGVSYVHGLAAAAFVLWPEQPQRRPSLAITLALSAIAAVIFFCVR